MSSNTENLELFKYDPVADKDQTFNIELALNQNWDKVDKEIAQREGLLRSSAVKEGVSDTDAIAIVDDADSSKTKRVLWSTIKSALSKIYLPLTRKINSKSLSSDVTLTGADIQVSETDNTKIDAALSNKADRGEKWLSESWMTIPVGKRLWFYTGGMNGYYLTNNGTDFEVHDHDDHLLMSINYSRPPKITDGTYLSTATPSQEYDLPLQNGWTASQSDVCKYSKDQFGVVHISLSVIPDAPVSIQSIIGTLPVGFRPRMILHRAIAFSTVGGLGMAVVTGSGELYIYPFSEMRDVTASIFFVAAD